MKHVIDVIYVYFLSTWYLKRSFEEKEKKRSAIEMNKQKREYILMKLYNIMVDHFNGQWRAF